MKRLSASAVGLAASDRLLLSAFIDLVALTDGHVFALDMAADAVIVFVNPASAEGDALLGKPSPGIHYVSYGNTASNRPFVGWTLPMPVRLGPLREILISIVERRRSEKGLVKIDARSEVSAKESRETVNPERETQTTGPLVAAHRKLEHLLRMLERVAKDRVAHAIYGVAGVEITLFPDIGKVTISGEHDAWGAALLGATRNLTAMPRVGAHIDKNAKSLSFEQFRWQLARTLSQGLLLPGIAEMQKFSLLRWPDFGTLGAASPHELRLCAMLTSQPESIERMLRVVPCKRTDVVALLNACALVRCLRDAPSDLLTSASGSENSADFVPALAPQTNVAPKTVMPETAPAQPSQTQRGMLGFLGKLRAALSFAPRTNA
jgi:hypothetical protein